MHIHEHIALIPTRVQNGFAFLDSKRPGWEPHINLETFDIGSSCECTLGQLCSYESVDTRMNRTGSRFDVMCQILGLSVDDIRIEDYAFGFVSPYSDARSQNLNYFAALNAEWLTRLRARRALRQTVEAELAAQKLIEIRPVDCAHTVAMCMMVVLVLLVGNSAWAQTTLPDPRADFAIDYDPQFDMVYGPADALPGQPYVASITLKLAAVAPATGTRTVTVPRAQLVKTGVSPEAPNGTSISIPDIPMPIGSFTVNASWIDGTGVTGVASNSVPFSAARQPPLAPEHFRLSAQRP